MTAKLESYTLLLEPSTCDRLRWLSASTRIPAAAIVREVLGPALDRWEQDRARARSEAQWASEPQSRNWLQPPDCEDE